ncbi:outer membrane beta-barrel protein [Bradyrhizobium sp. ISRA443]|uniref:outer membrane protein n=1 Tax=unclassified Bradyrhizobium TaxID=2631580 RepID=UPI002478967D|nr:MULTISPECIES: outer membrane beta-barrel protein [unclassified Bradyrhizobium]WGR95274.1 outer membrane beta-barrel protein [Bradyrhizobium sp. ISRA435]WGS00232.1 outer membrane beta-barrel protein [Bradyrhizobium sp. ISRA436]WGS07121.1 outer membrane beta-barrel protein [Bradyrhizobium sp. ISRA437]WGS14006.1 outer membrane beta-barrel protein [Bradyrhizobium sp. ISRA443]
MRRLLLAAMMFGAVTGAGAADMPILRGGFTEGVARPTTNWEGFYIGGQAGYGSSDENFSGTNANMLSALLDHNVIQQMDVANWNLGLGKQSQRSPAYGGFVGYNWQFDDVVVGAEMSYMHANNFGGTSTATKELVSGSKLSDSMFHDVRVDSSAAIAITDLATFRARAGYAWGCFLPYMFGGVALGNANISRSVTVFDSISATGAAGSFTSLATLSASDVLHNHLVYGYSGGLGVDVNLMAGLFMRAEWEYARITSTVDTNINTVRVGVGYKF